MSSKYESHLSFLSRNREYNRLPCRASDDKHSHLWEEKYAIFHDGRRNNIMKIEKLRIGKTYYLPQRGCPTNYMSGVLVEIVSKIR